MMTHDSRYGRISADWNSRAEILSPSSHSRIAIKIANIVPNTMNATLYSNVFLVMINASFVLNKKRKFCSPIQSLLKIPFT